jgi:uncharacterized protein (TIGR02757 family)
VHRFERKEDIEIVGLLIATIAWGKRDMIIRSGERILDIMGHEPYLFIKTYTSNTPLEFVHRTFNGDDLDFFFRSLQSIYQRLGSLEAAFCKHEFIPGLQGRIVSFRNEMLRTPHDKRSEKHLSDPSRNSAAKRLNMFLRWMVRRDKRGVDFGIWKTISPAELSIPLDVHTARIARDLELLKRKQNDWKAVEEIMQTFRAFDPEDPAKYDFALFGIGVFER